MSYYAINIKCCQDCQHYDEEWSESTQQTYTYCALNVFFPTRKETCKRQKPYKKRMVLGYSVRDTAQVDI